MSVSEKLEGPSATLISLPFEFTNCTLPALLLAVTSFAYVVVTLAPDNAA